MADNIPYNPSSFGDALLAANFLDPEKKKNKEYGRSLLAEIYRQQNREDLAVKEAEEIAIIEKFLPKQLTEAELKEAIAPIIAQIGATSVADLGKVMGVASKQLSGKADGKTISAVVKELLTK